MILSHLLVSNISPEIKNGRLIKFKRVFWAFCIADLEVVQLLESCGGNLHTSTPFHITRSLCISWISTRLVLIFPPCEKNFVSSIRRNFLGEFLQIKHSLCTCKHLLYCVYTHTHILQLCVTENLTSANI